MQFLKNAVKEALLKNTLVKMLDERLSGMEDARSHKIIHISDLSRSEGFCPREFVLLDITKGKPKAKYISTAMRVAFDNGLALHDLCRNKWLEEDVVGNWKCLYCSYTEEFSKKPKGKCPGCGSKHLWRYEEPVFIDPETRASGSIDFFIDLGLGKHVMVEVKSIAKDNFGELVAPLSEHRIRTQMYLLLLSRSNSPHLSKVDLSRGLILYISKGFGQKSEELGKVLPFKEFSVDRNDSGVLELYMQANKVTLFREGKGQIPAGICPSSMAPRVKSCGAVDACWSGKYPAVI